MSILTVVLVLVVIGILLWAVNTYIPLDPKIRQILNIVVVLFVVIWLLGAFGLFDALRGVKVGKVG